MHALFAGSFDPPSLGHLDIIRRAAAHFKQLTIGIAVNASKSRHLLFNTEEKIALMKQITHGMPGVEVVALTGLVVDYAKAHNISVLVRGLRNHLDVDIEYQMAMTNRQLSGLDTFFMLADGKYAHISCTLIREIGAYGKRLHGFVPDAIEELVFNKLI